MEIDGYCYIQKLGESINKLQEGYIWIVENTSVGTETEFKQYRTVSVSEKEEGIYGITGVKYIDSKYNYLEKGMELQKTYNGPPITVPSPNPPKNVTSLVINDAKDLFITWDTVKEASSYRVRIYGDGACVQTVEVVQADGDQQEYTLNLTPYLSRGKSAAYSAVVYSIS